MRFLLFLLAFWPSLAFAQSFQTPVENEELIPKLVVMRGKTAILGAPLVKAEAIGEGNLRQKAVDAGYELGLRLFTTYVLRK
jgi:hypothetical protein